jgi:predicted nucleic acid-binding protein
VIYADSSVIVKRYYEEPGTQQVRERWTGANRVFTSRVSYAEVHAALARKRRDGGLSVVAYRAASAAFEAEWPAYDQVHVDVATLADVRRLVQRYPLRGFDAIHLAAALWLRKELGRQVEFWAADDRLEAAAKRERLAGLNPERSG